MIISEELKKGFYATADFWKEQAEGKLLDSKDDWPRYNELEGLKNNCAFCEYFEDCEKCPLNKCDCHWKFFRFHIDNYWTLWAWHHNPSVRRYGAIMLWLKIKKWMKKNLPEYFRSELV